MAPSGHRSRRQGAMTDEVSSAPGVPAGDPAQGIRIETGPFGPWETKPTLCGTAGQRMALVVDPGMGASGPRWIGPSANGLRLHLIADSHGHVDHISTHGPSWCSGAPLAIHPDDAYRSTAGTSTDSRVEAVTASRECATASRSASATSCSTCPHAGAYRGLRMPVRGAARHPPRRRRPVRRQLRPDRSRRRETTSRWSPPSRGWRARSRRRPACAGHGPETTIEREIPWLRRTLSRAALSCAG